MRLIYDNATGESIAASGTWKSDIITIEGNIYETKVMIELTYHAAATAGGRVDIITIQPDGSTEETDVYTDVVTPSFAAGATKSKTGEPVNVYGLKKIKVAVVNLDAGQAVTLKKLYLK